MSETTKTVYVCKRCGYDTELKTNLKRHLEKRIACPDKFSKEARETLLQELAASVRVVRKTTQEHTCEACGGLFSHQSSLSRHLKVCKAQKDNEILTIVKSLQDRVKQLEEEKVVQVVSGNVTQNYNITQNLHIHLNNFGSEDVSHITPDMIEYCIMNPSRGFVKLIKDVHFNPEMPCNHNIKHKSSKQNILERYIDGNWVPCDASNTLDELIRKNYRIINCYYIEKYENDPSIQDDPIKQRIYEKHRFLHDKNCNEYYAVKRELRILIKDQTMFLLQPPDTVQES